MRIIAGAHRGRTLKSVAGFAVRPTSDRLRETLFNVLGPAIQGAVFVDAYAGTGAVGLEAASRGAKHVWLIEEDASAARAIQSNIDALKVGGQVTLVRAPVKKGIRSLEERGIQADYWFLDPPYAAVPQYEQSLRWLSESKLLAPDAVVIVQHSRKEVPPDAHKRMARVRLLNQSSNALSFYKINDERHVASDDT
jgi:16S rRNA (guanine966-N2)-methyltransferase